MNRRKLGKEIEKGNPRHRDQHLQSSRCGKKPQTREDSRMAGSQGEGSTVRENTGKSGRL